MIKGFIEVTCQDNKKRIININYIEEVYKNLIYMAFNCPDSLEQDYFECKETYEEIKKKIEEALG